MAHIEDIGELEGKKSLFTDILVFFKAKEIWKEPGDFSLDFQVLLSVCNYKNCLIERLYMFSKLQ